MSSEGVQFTGTIPTEYVEKVTYVVSDDMVTECLSGQLLVMKYGRYIVLVIYQAMKMSEFIKTSDTFKNAVYSDKVTMKKCVDHFGSEAANSWAKMGRAWRSKNVYTRHESYSSYPTLAYLDNPELVYDKLTIQTVITALFTTCGECDALSIVDDEANFENRNINIIIHTAMS